jgi:hypothetical protein
MDILTSVKLLALGWLVAHFEPLHWIIDAIFVKMKSKLAQYIHASFGCWKCMAFWTTLALSGNIYMAAFNAMVAYLITEWTNN